MKFYDLITSAVEEGIVLLKNEETLPFTKNDKVSVFGRCQIDWYKSGTGSGGSVHVPFSINLIQGFDILRNTGFDCPVINQDLVQQYVNWIKENPFDGGNGEWASEPWCQKEMVITDDFVKTYCDDFTKAVFVIGRTAGEDQDNKTEEGSYYLTKDERECLKVLCRNFKKVTVLLNVSNIIDLSWLNDREFENISAVLFVWQGGMQGGSGCANVLCGKANPSGKLTDTIAYSVDDYPSTANFGSATNEIYAEDIYVGYRYFTTFARDKVMYPFGFGLSYTDFTITEQNCLFENDIVTYTAKVTNTGKFAGKETVQLYVKAPQGKLGKSLRSLCGWYKTPLLQSGESCEVKIECPIACVASYDDSGVTGYPYSYVLEEGEYYIYAGTDCMSCDPVKFGNDKSFSIEKTYAVKTLTQCLAPETPFKRMKGESCSTEEELSLIYEDTPLSQEDLAKKIRDSEMPAVPYTGNVGITFNDVKKDRELLDAFIAQFSTEELMTIVRGEGMMSRKVTPGIASAFGGISEALHDYGIVAAGCSDGPSGIRLDNGKEATLVPIGTLLACTWNTELVKSLYEYVGKEMEEYNIDLLLGPGCNIHRNPLNGRNFEYFSEDPLISGYMASAVVQGLAVNGAIGTVKHFAANNQESHRRTVNAVVSERALREIYLKPFEIAITGGGAKAVMTAYNGINGHWCASNFDLNKSILRDEWHFDGMVMTDWWAAMNDCVKGGEATVRNMAQMVKARNDVYMVVVNDTADKGGFGDNLAESLEEEYLTVSEIQICAKDVINFLCMTNAAKKELRPLRNEITGIYGLKEYPENCKSYEIRQNVQGEELNGTMYFNITEKCSYNITGAYYKDGGDTLSQSVTNLMINDVPCGSFECRSTDGKVIYTTAVQLELDKGVYKIDLVDTKPGISIKNLCIVPANESPVTWGVFK